MNRRLPADDRGRDGETKKSYQLSGEDWETILSLDWPETESKIIHWLHEHNNGPLQRADFLAVCGEEPNGLLTRRINRRLDNVSTYVILESGRYFKFSPIRTGGPYAIWKFGYLE